MKIKIQQNFSKNTAKVFFGEKQVDYNFRGPTIPHIFGYPYLDFLWPDENAKEGSEYTLETSNGLNLNVAYKEICTKKQGPFFHIWVKEEGNLDFGGESHEFERKINDNYLGEGSIMKMVEKGKYESLKSSSVSTKIGDYEEETTKNQFFDGRNYYKFVNVRGEGSTPEINEALKLLYPGRELLSDFNRREFDIDLAVLERVIKRNGIRDQIFEKFILQLDESRNPIKVVDVIEEFLEDIGNKEMYEINVKEDKVVSAVSGILIKISEEQS